MSTWIPIHFSPSAKATTPLYISCRDHCIDTSCPTKKPALPAALFFLEHVEYVSSMSNRMTANSFSPATLAIVYLTSYSRFKTQVSEWSHSRVSRSYDKVIKQLLSPLGASAVCKAKFTPGLSAWLAWLMPHWGRRKSVSLGGHQSVSFTCV